MLKGPTAWEITQERQKRTQERMATMAREANRLVNFRPKALQPQPPSMPPPAQVSQPLDPATRPVGYFGTFFAVLASQKIKGRLTLAEADAVAAKPDRRLVGALEDPPASGEWHA